MLKSSSEERIEMRPVSYTHLPNVAAGTIEKQKIHSELLKNEHDLSIYLPAGYEANAAPYDLVVIFDESAYLSKIPTPIILDNLVAATKIPAAVAVLIANPSQATRNEELSPNPKFADFLAKELVPWIRAHYNITNDPGKTVVAGSSLGGLAAAYAGYKHPEIFTNVLCQSDVYKRQGQKDEPATSVEVQQEFHPNGRRNHAYTPTQDAATKPAQVATDAWQQICQTYLKEWVTEGQRAELEAEYTSGIAAGNGWREIGVALGQIVRCWQRGR